MILETFSRFDPKYYSTDIVQGVKILRELKTEKKEGIYKLGENIKLIIESYDIKYKSVNESLFEVHEHTLDIQYPIKGYEMTYYTPLCQLNLATSYDIKNDRALYKYDSSEVSQIITGNQSFAIFYPGDPHSPQKAHQNNEQIIKKATIKLIY